MVMVYVTLISKGAKTIDDVPKNLKEAVLKELNNLGLDGYGKPLN